MRATYRKWEPEDGTGRKRVFAGKIILRPETPEEQAELDGFRAHIGSPQRGRSFEIIYRRREPKPDAGTVVEAEPAVVSVG